MANETQGDSATEFCTNCKRDIPAVNYLMHQNHCSRNIVLCKQCMEPVPRTEMENHNVEYHAKVTCKCGEAVEKCKQEEHDADLCPQRQVVCQYCEMEMDHKDVAEHTDFCGSRTDLCPVCRRYIAFRDMARHEASNCSLPEARPARPNAELPPSLLLSSSSAALRDQRPRNQLPNRLAFPAFLPKTAEGVGEGRWGRDASTAALTEAVDRKHRKNQDRIQNVMAKQQPRGREKNEERALLQSAANQELDRQLAQRLAQDLPYKAGPDTDFSAGDLPSGYMPQPLGDFHNDFALQRILKETYSVPDVNTFQDHSANLGGVTLPCEFCQRPIPAEDLIQHQSGCRPDIACEPAPEPRANNSRERSHHHPQPPADVLNNLGYEMPYGQTLPGYSAIDRSLSPVTYDDDNTLMLPCEFCEVLLPIDALPMHQVNCVENRTVTPAPTTFDPGSGSLTVRRDGPTESPMRPTPLGVQRPQDLPGQPKEYHDDKVYVDASVDDDNDEPDPVRIAQPRPRPSASRFGQPTHGVRAARFQSDPRPPPLLPPAVPRSASEKYLNSAKRGPPPAKPTATVTSLPTGGAVTKPRTRNTGRSEFDEERPRSKSDARVQEILQSLCEVPEVASEPNLNNAVLSAQSSRPGLQGTSYVSKQMNNGSHYKAKKKAFPAASFRASGLDAEDEPLPAAPSRPPALNPGPAKTAWQPSAGARQKVRKADRARHGAGYSPSFPGGAPPRKGRDGDRRGHGSGTHKPKQAAGPNTVTLDADGLNSALKLKEDTSIQKRSNRQPANRRQVAPRFQDDP